MTLLQNNNREKINILSLNFVPELNKQNEIAKKNLEKIQAQLKSTDSELTALKKVATFTMLSHNAGAPLQNVAFCIGQ